MWTLFLIWLAGGFANLGVLDGIMNVEGGKADVEVKIIKFIQSWYAFGMILGIMLAEIGKNTEKEKNKF